MHLSAYRKLLGLLFLFSSGAACAQQVFKCDEGKQRVSYQSQPCPGATLRSWEAAPDVIDPAVEQRIDAMRRELRSTQRSSGTRQRSGRRRAPAVSACEQARRGRSAAYEKAGLKRDFKLSSHWDNRVHSACR